ncbi:MAG: 50S ribosomal protein L25 [Endomicrobium sp.]|jgi:large subunit ribosomal protein L25|nr:50S ribosomal protein L25 [Endomicrobium sp.]
MNTQKIILNAEIRNDTINLKLLKQLNKKIPAVLYGKNITSKSLMIDSKAFKLIIKKNGDNAVINLHIQEDTIPVIVKDIQRDILSQDIIHIDFQTIIPQHSVEVFVPIFPEGVAEGVKNFGGIMEFILHEVKIKAFPDNIPQKITVDISHLHIGEGITIADLPHINGVKYLHNSSQLIIHIVQPSVSDKNVTNTESNILSSTKESQDTK